MTPTAALDPTTALLTQRAQDVADFLASLTDRERGLVHDAAVMGYVRGSLIPRGVEIPLNEAIVTDVVGACFVFPDLYPTVNASPAPRPIAQQWVVETRWSNGEWRRYGALYDDPDEALARFHDDIDATRSRHAFRLVQATTTYTVVALHDTDDDTKED